MEFVECKDRQNREDCEEVKSKRKGVRELHSLACSINYDKSREFHKEKQACGREEREFRGSFSLANEDSLLKHMNAKDLGFDGVLVETDPHKSRPKQLCNFLNFCYNLKEKKLV